MRILTISGSPRGDESLTNVLCKTIDDIAKKHFDETELWLIGDKPLPLAHPEWHSASGIVSAPDVVRSFADAVDAADVVVLSSPIYHGSYTGCLKNALDVLRWDHFRGKTVILASQGNPVGSGITLSHLNEVVRTVQGTVHNSYIVVDRVDIDVENQSITNSKSIERIEGIISSLSS